MDEKDLVESMHALKVAQLRELAKDFHVCLGYSASKKNSTICAIVTHCRVNGLLGDLETAVMEVS